MTDMTAEERADKVLHPHHPRFGECVRQIRQAEAAAKERLYEEFLRRVVECDTTRPKPVYCNVVKRLRALAESEKP